MLDRSIEITMEDIAQELRQGGKKANWDEMDVEGAIDNFKHCANGCSITFWYPTIFLAGLRKVGAKEEDFKSVDKLLKQALTILYDILVSTLSMNFPPDALRELNAALLLVYSTQTIRLAEQRRKENE